MKTLIMAFFFLMGTAVAHADSTTVNLSDWSRCSAAKTATDGMLSIYVTQGTYCNQDSDCKWADYIGGSPCGSMIVNKEGAAGMELMKESDEYQRMVTVVSEETSKGLCGPQPMCSSMAPGELKCSAEKQCFFQID